MWPNPQETADLVTFTKEIFNRKLQFLCSGIRKNDSSEKTFKILQKRKRKFSGNIFIEHVKIKSTKNKFSPFYEFIKDTFDL